MTASFGADARFEMEAIGEDWLYDCHGRRFAAIDHGARATSGFTPLYLARLFGVDMRAWPSLIERAAAVAADGGEAWEAWLRAHRPRTTPSTAAQIALLAYPSMQRFLCDEDGPRGSFQLRSSFLWQPNAPIGRLWDHRCDHSKSLVAGEDSFVDDAARSRVTEELRARRGPAEFGSAAPGVYVVGHSSILVRSAAGGVLLDPVHGGRLSTAGALGLSRLRAEASAIAITHGHFDHYHLPSLLALDLPISVPDVPRASIVCEDMRERLMSFGAYVTARGWHSAWESADSRVHVLPFVGEQFLSSETHPDARNWGNCYVVETEDHRVLIAADAGFEPGRSIIDEVERWTNRFGPVDVVVVQAIGMCVTFGGGDPDLQLTALTSPHRAEEAFELLHPSKRVTLAPADLPELVAACGAKAVIPYGQFRFDRGASVVHPDAFEEVQRSLRAAGASAVAVPLRVGQGLTPAGDIVELPP